MRYIFLILLISLSGCVTEGNLKHETQMSETDILLQSGYRKLSLGNRKDAIIDFDKVIDLCKDVYSRKGNRFYASRGQLETIYYMTKAAADNEQAMAIGPSCADALYIRSYASLDLGQIELAEEYLKRAIDMSPVNSMYLSELGHVYHTKEEWGKALDLFMEAENAAEFSPPELKANELSRAKRGVGYSLIELGRLDEARVKYKECLEINKNDTGALRELEYIKNMIKNASD